MVDSTAYDAHRIALGVPRGGWTSSMATHFPHETNMDRLHGVDFDKGCYVGQEVVSRMQHRAPRARERSGSFWTAGRQSRGQRFSPAVTGRHHGNDCGHRGLALIRTDRTADALEAGIPLTSAALPSVLAEPDELRSAPRQTVA